MRKMPDKLDRFAQGHKDPQEELPVAYCAGCGGEIYPYDDVYIIGNDMVCQTVECVWLYLQNKFDARRDIAIDAVKEEF